MRLRSGLPSLTGATKWLNSKELSSRDLIGEKPVLIHFWSVSCKQCQAVIRNINQLRDHYKEKIHVIAVHMPRSEKDFNMEEIRSVAKRYDIVQPIYVDNDHILTDLFSNRLVPSSYLFDQEGKLRHRQIGEKGMSLMNKRLIRIIG